MFPKLNPTSHPENELSNGHTHFVLLGNEKNKMKWGEEAALKLELAKRIAKGRPKYGSHRGCKVLAIFFGDNEESDTELALVSGNDSVWEVQLASAGGSWVFNSIANIQRQNRKGPRRVRPRGR